MEIDRSQLEIPGIVKIEKGQGELEKIIIQTAAASAEIYLHGAHVTHFQPAGHQPVIWMSRASWFEPGKPIRGGVPICFPWFGPRADDPKSPAHGFARLRDWKIESVTKNESGQVVVTLMLRSDDATRALWPADFAARHIVTIGSMLEMKLAVQNTSGKPIRFEEALHTYLAIGDIRQASVEGLGGTKYIDKVDGAKIKDQIDPLIRFTGETDRVYLDTQATCIVHDPVMQRVIEIAKSGSSATVVWNPWIAKARAMADFGDEEWQQMLCIETANVALHAVELPAGATHEMSARIRVCPIR